MGCSWHFTRRLRSRGSPPRRRSGGLETWLPGHTDGALVCAGVKPILMTASRARTAEAYLSAPADADQPYGDPETYPDSRGSESWTTLNDVAGWVYYAYATCWAAALEEILK